MLHVWQKFLDIPEIIQIVIVLHLWIDYISGYMATFSDDFTKYLLSLVYELWENKLKFWNIYFFI